MKTKELKDKEILVRAYKAVIEELGIAGFTRFIQLTQGGKNNWTEERDTILSQLNTMDLNDLVEFIRKTAKGPQKNQQVI